MRKLIWREIERKRTVATMPVVSERNILDTMHIRINGMLFSYDDIADMLERLREAEAWEKATRHWQDFTPKPAHVNEPCLGYGNGWGWATR